MFFVLIWLARKTLANLHQLETAGWQTWTQTHYRSKWPHHLQRTTARRWRGREIPQAPLKKTLSFVSFWGRRNFPNFVKRCFWQILIYLGLFVNSAYVTASFPVFPASVLYINLLYHLGCCFTGSSWIPRNSWPAWHQGTQSECLLSNNDLQEWNIIDWVLMSVFLIMRRLPTLS